jgi:threonylcarbamoyladenosine tRNA methylthiotransferase MtaB
MRRRYKKELFAERINLIKKLMPHACIGADVIVGFPGETDEDFNETAHFIVLTFHFFSGKSTNLAKFSAQN